MGESTTNNNRDKENKAGAAYRLDELRHLFNQFESMVLSQTAPPNSFTLLRQLETGFSNTSHVTNEAEALTTNLTVAWATALDSAIERSEKTILLLLLKMVERPALVDHLPPLVRSYTLYAQGILTELEDDFHQSQLYYTEALTLLTEQTSLDQPEQGQELTQERARPVNLIKEKEAELPGLATPGAIPNPVTVVVADRLKLALTVRLGVALLNQNEREKAAVLLWPLLEQWQARQVIPTSNSTGLIDSQREEEGKGRQLKAAAEESVANPESGNENRNGQLDGLMLSAVGRLYYLDGDFEKAIEYTEQAVELARRAKDRVGESRALDKLGVYCGIQNRYEESCRYFEAAIALRTALGNTRQLGSTYINLGLSYAHLGQPRRTIEAYNIGLTLIKQLNNHRGAALTCINLAQVYKEQKEPAKALAAGLEALEELAKLEISSNTNNNNDDSSIQQSPLSLHSPDNHKRPTLNVGTAEPTLAVAALAEVVSDTSLLGQVNEARYYWQELSRLAPLALAQKLSPVRRAAIYNGLSEAGLHILILAEAESYTPNANLGRGLIPQQELAAQVLDYHHQAVKLYEEIGDQDSLRLMLETEVALLLAPAPAPANYSAKTAPPIQQSYNQPPKQSASGLSVTGRLSYQETAHQLLGDWWAHFWSNLAGGAGPDNLNGWATPAGLPAPAATAAATIRAGSGESAKLTKRQNRLQLALAWAKRLFEQGYSEESRVVYLAPLPQQNQDQAQSKEQGPELTLLELAVVELAGVQPVELIEHYSILATLVPATQGLKWVEAGLLLLKKANSAQFPQLRDKKKKLELLQKELRTASNRR